MAWEEGLRTITLIADSTLAVKTGVSGIDSSGTTYKGNQYRCVKSTATARTVQIVALTTDLTLGIMQNKPQVTGAAATVAIAGVSLAEAGGTITAGDLVSVDTSGRVVTLLASGTNPTTVAQLVSLVGTALTGATVGQLTSVLLRLGQ